MSMTEQEWAEYQRRVRIGRAQKGRVRGQVGANTMPKGRRTALQPTSQSIGAATGEPRYRSKLEKSWAGYLNGLCKLGAIINFWYEPLNLRLPGEKNFYKPDFLVLAGDGLTFYEIKGRNKSDDRSLVKIKTAAGITPWARFVLVKRVNGQWEERVL